MFSLCGIRPVDRGRNEATVAGVHLRGGVSSDVGCRMASIMGCLRAEAATNKAAVLADVDPMIGVLTVIPWRGARGASSLSS